MTKKIITPYFPKGLKFIAPIICFTGLFIAFSGLYIFGLSIAVICVLIMTTNYVTEIDLTAKVIDDYMTIVWIDFNHESRIFQTIDKIVINKGNYAQNVQSRVQSRTMQWSDYTATLILNDETRTIDLLTRTDKKDLLLELKSYSDFLKVGVEDHTTRDPYWIDMSQVTE